MNKKEKIYEYKEIKVKKLICKKCKEKYNKEINVIVYPYNQNGDQLMFCENEKDIHFQLLTKDEVENIKKNLNS